MKTKEEIRRAIEYKEEQLADLRDDLAEAENEYLDAYEDFKEAEEDYRIAQNKKESARAHRDGLTIRLDDWEGELEALLSEALTISEEE